MKEHIWIIETIDSGPMGINDFVACSGCGAGGGPYMINPKTKQPLKRWPAFYPGTGLQLGDDCDKAKILIAEFNEANPWFLESHVKSSQE